MQCDVVNFENETVDTVELDEAVFGVAVRPDILARCVNWQLAKRRAGTHKVKSRNEVALTSAKPFRQKGTGRARQGSRKGPHQRGGGVAFGPKVRDHAHDLPKKVRRLALKTALSAKCAAGDLVVLDTAQMSEPKTRILADYAKSLGWRSVLVIDGDAVDAGFARAARNLVGVDVLPTRGANVYDILRRNTLVLTRAAVDKLVERLK
ncbi:MAG: 50S ribosomal protein L4 [Rhodospirillales bacterium]|nr:50S ribosomal protein L4 [Rhodospirillales bacterium]